MMTTDESPLQILRASAYVRLPPGEESTHLMWQLVQAVAATSAVSIFTSGASKERWVRQLLSMAANVPLDAFTHGHLNTQQWSRLETAAEDISNRPIYIDASTRSAVHILASCVWMMHDRTLGLVVINMCEGFDEAAAQCMAEQIGVPILLVEQTDSEPPDECCTNSTHLIC